MATNEKITIDESQAIRALKNIIKGYEDADKAGDKFAKGTKQSMTDADKATQTLDKSTEGLIKELDGLVKKQDQSQKSTSQATDALKGAAAQTTIFGVNVGATVTALNAKIAALKGVRSGLASTTGLLKVFKVALASTGIGLLIVGLGSLVTYFTRTQKGIDTAKQALAAFGSIVDNVVDRISKFGGGLIEIFKGNPKKGIEELTGAFSGLGKEIREDAAAALELEKRSQALRDAMRELNVEQQKTNALIQDHKFKAKDLQLTEEERIANLKKAQELSTDIETKRLALAQENLEIITERNSLAESFVEDLDAQAEAEANLSRIQAEGSRKRKADFAEEQSIRRQLQQQKKKEREEAAKIAQQEADEIQKLQEAYTDMISDIDERIASADLEKLTGEDRLRAERELALTEIDILETKAKAAAEAAGVAFEAEKQFYALRAQVQENFVNEIQKSRGNSDPLSPLETRGGAVGEKVGLELTKAMKDTIEKQTRSSNPFERLRETLKESLLIDDDVLDDALAGIKDLFGNILDGIESNVDAQIEANDELLESIRSQTDTIEGELEKQQGLREQGFANDVTLNKMKLEQLKKDEAEALEEQKKLKKQKNALETIDQVSSLITASANIFQAFSAIPIVGVPLAIAAIAAMFGTFIATKARAGAATRAYKGGALGDYLGGERNSGFVDKSGPSDIYGRGDGIPVGDTGLVLGGSEFITSEGPAREHEKHLRNLNRGKYKGIDIEAALSAIPNHSASVVRFKARQSTINEQRAAIALENQRIAIREGLGAAIKGQTQEIIGYLSTKKNITGLDKDTYIEYTDTDTHIIKKVGS